MLDLSSKNCFPVAAFDPCGLVFAIAYTETLGGHSFNKVALYDLSKYEDGCFENWNYIEIKKLDEIISHVQLSRNKDYKIFIKREINSLRYQRIAYPYN